MNFFNNCNTIYSIINVQKRSELQTRGHHIIYLHWLTHFVVTCLPLTLAYYIHVTQPTMTNSHFTITCFCPSRCSERTAMPERTAAKTRSHTPSLYDLSFPTVEHPDDRICLHFLHW